jgi:hypothetical protein
MLSQAVPTASRTTLSTSLVLACLACTADAPAPTFGEQPVGEQTPDPAPTREVTMLTPYFEIGEQLAADRTEGLDMFGRAVIGSTAQERNEPGMDRVHAAAQRLGTTSELEAARAVYRDMSHALLDYLDAHPDARTGLHLMYCPMTFDNQGAYWVSRTSKLRNPYEGSRMLECGARLEWDAGVEHRKRWAAAQARGTP